MSVRLLVFILPLALQAQWITPAELPAAYRGKAYSAGPLALRAGVRCIDNDVTYRVVSGSLPRGIQLSPSGYIDGLAETAAGSSVVLRAANGCGQWEQSFRLHVSEPPVLTATVAEVRFAGPWGGESPPPSGFRIQSNTPGLAYTLEYPAMSWLVVHPQSGIASDKGDLVEISVDPRRALPGTRSLTIWATAWQAVPVPISVCLNLSLPTVEPVRSSANTRLPPLAPPRPFIIPPAPIEYPTVARAGPTVAVAKPKGPVQPQPRFGFRRWPGRPAPPSGSVARSVPVAKPSPLGPPAAAHPPAPQPEPQPAPARTSPPHPPYVQSPRAAKAAENKH